jgi:hypothetical protein
MRAGSVSARGGVAIAATTAKPQTVERIVDAVAGMFGMAPTVDFAPVDGVYKAEVQVDARANGLQATQRVNAAAEGQSVRLYNRRGREVYMQPAELGRFVDERA